MRTLTRTMPNFSRSSSWSASSLSSDRLGGPSGPSGPPALGRALALAVHVSEQRARHVQQLLQLLRALQLGLLALGVHVLDQQVQQRRLHADNEVMTALTDCQSHTDEECYARSILLVQGYNKSSR